MQGIVRENGPFGFPGLLHEGVPGQGNGKSSVLLKPLGRDPVPGKRQQLCARLIHEISSRHISSQDLGYLPSDAPYHLGQVQSRGYRLTDPQEELSLLESVLCFLDGPFSQFFGRQQSQHPAQMLKSRAGHGKPGPKSLPHQYPQKMALYDDGQSDALRKTDRLRHLVYFFDDWGKFFLNALGLLGVTGDQITLGIHNPKADRLRGYFSQVFQQGCRLAAAQKLTQGYRFHFTGSLSDDYPDPYGYIFRTPSSRQASPSPNDLSLARSDKLPKQSVAYFFLSGKR